MARKKRRIEQAVPVAANEPAEKPRYQDPFQSAVSHRIEEAGKVFEGKGRTILYGIGALAVLGIIIAVFVQWNNRSQAAAQTALGKGIEIMQAQVTDVPPLAGSTEKTYKTQRERAEAAIAEFESVAREHGGAAAEKAKYFAAVNRLYVDREMALSELEAMAAGSGEVATLATFASAQARFDAGQFDLAAAHYRKLSTGDGTIIPLDTIKLELGNTLEKQGNKEEAVNIFFEIAKTASEAKDKEGKSIPLSSAALEAKDRLKELAPEKAKEIPEPDPAAAGMPFGF
ncbi:MAG: hypothetical protein IPM21_15610 [Acidobacteria bacterium]|nr:hypothetical protein [Acidobacteriota bacterium]